MKTLALSALLPLCLLASCASDGGADKTAAAPARRPTMNERFGGGGRDPNSYQQDSEGKLKLENAKRSQFESVGGNSTFRKSFGKKDFKTESYARKAWLGGKDYATTRYAGNTDGSRFQKTSGLSGQGARESGLSAGVEADYRTGSYATTAAREARAGGIAKPDNDLIENRRKSYQQPQIVDWRSNRPLTIEQSKGLLGN